MEPNAHSNQGPDELAALTAAIDDLEAEDVSGLPYAVRVERVLELRSPLSLLEIQWLKQLAAVDARGAAGAEQGRPAASTAAWLRDRLHMDAAATSVRIARALFPRSLTATADALAAGEFSPAHAAVLAHGTRDSPPTRRGRRPIQVPDRWPQLLVSRARR